MHKALERGTVLTLVSRKAGGLAGSPYFSVFWLAAQLKGMVRNRYYEGKPLPEYFVAVIPGYWCGGTQRDDTAEDGLISTLYTDPRSVRRGEEHCEMALQKSAPASQHGFLRSPAGDADNRQAWQPGPLPGKTARGKAAGGLCVLARVPGLGLMTREEFEQVASGYTVPDIPDYLFPQQAGFAPGPHRVILCREDVREGLLHKGRRNKPLGELLHGEAVVPREMLAAQLERMLAAMKENEDFEVALMPRGAFAKLELEWVCWPGRAAVGWLQNGSDSMLTVDAVTLSSFETGMQYTWDKLQKGWKRRRTVAATLRKWLAGEGLDMQEKESQSVENWGLMPKE